MRMENIYGRSLGIFPFFDEVVKNRYRS
jgi:hypothetical protein